MNKNNNFVKKGFTVIEIAITITIIALIIAGIIKSTIIIDKSKDATASWFAGSDGSSLSDVIQDGLEIWYDAANINGNKNLGIRTGDKISQWNDLSGNNHHALQSEVIKRPTLQVDKGTYYVDFNAKNSAQNYMMSQANVNVPSSVTLFAVFRFEKDTESWSRIANMGHDGFFDLRRYTNSKELAWNINNSNSPRANYVDGIWGVFAGRFNRANNERNLFYNSVKSSEGSTYYNVANNQTFNIGTTILNNDDENFDGGIKEILLYNRALEDWEITRMLAYLANKWNLKDKVDSDGDGIVDLKDNM